MRKNCLGGSMSLVLAKILGIYVLAIGLAFFINTNRLKNIFIQVRSDENFLLMGGILALLIGAVLITLHNQWIYGWPLIITIIGWWSLIKGFALIVSSKFIGFFSFLENRSMMFYKTISMVYILIGLFLLYKSLEG